MPSADQFDAYYAWLGISPEDLPAHHYRLLDVRLLEDDPEVIDVGYQRRIAFLKGVRAGEREALLDRIKNELSEARRALLMPAEKNQYDAILRLRFGYRARVDASPLNSTAAVDPYYLWLGIPPDEMPASHYRLLDVRMFEADPEIIDLGFQRRMAYLRSIKDGDNLELAERLKDELATVRRELLSPAKRAAYDAELRARALPVHPVPPPIPAPPMPTPPSMLMATPVFSDDETEADEASLKGHALSADNTIEFDDRNAESDQAARRRLRLLATCLAASAVMLLGGIWFSLTGPEEPVVAVLPDEPPSTAPIEAELQPDLTRGLPPTPVRNTVVQSIPTSLPLTSVVPVLPKPTPLATPLAAATNPPNQLWPTPSATPSATRRSLLGDPAIATPTATASPVRPEPAATEAPLVPKREFALEFNGIRNASAVLRVPAIAYTGRSACTIEFRYTHSDRVKTRAMDCLVCGFAYMNGGNSLPYLAFRMTKLASDPSLSITGFDSLEDDPLAPLVGRSSFGPPRLIRVPIDVPKALPNRHHLALVVEPTLINGTADISLYVDGEQMARRSLQLPMIPAQFVVGGPGFIGIVDDLRLSNSARYKSDFTPPDRIEKDRETLALYQFDEGSGNQLNDTSGWGHHLRTIPVIMHWVPVAAAEPNATAGANSAAVTTQATTGTSRVTGPAPAGSIQPRVPRLR